LRLITKSTSTAEQNHWWMVSFFENQLRARLKTGSNPSSGTTTLISSDNLQTNIWYHATFVYDGSKMILYRDGVPRGSVAKTGALASGPNIPARIGQNPDGYGSFSGRIDELRIYNRGLSQSEVEELYVFYP
jgi:hypothetical protein